MPHRADAASRRSSAIDQTDGVVLIVVLIARIGVPKVAR